MPDVFVSQKPASTLPLPVKPVLKSDEEGERVGIFSSFVENPTDISFHHQEKDEKILLFLRSHFITNLKTGLIATAFATLPVIVSVVGFESLPFLQLPFNFVLVLTLIYYLLIFTFILINFLMWYYNILLVTQLRVIDIDFVELIFHDVAETKFSLIQDVNYTQTGVLRNLFNYGDVFAQTAGGKENIEALGVPNPIGVVDFITGLMRKGKHV